jgi:hypothetical protein
MKTTLTLDLSITNTPETNYIYKWNICIACIVY